MIVDFKESHFHAYMAAMMPSPLDHVRALKDDIFRSTGTVTWIENGQVLALGGIADMWNGVGEAWVLVTPEAIRRPIMLTKLGRSYLEQSQNEFRRIQATVASDFREGIRWLLSLGFSFEDPEGRPSKTPTSKMAEYGPDGKDYFMLSLGKGISWPQSR